MFAAVYFLCYLPYSGLVKALSGGAYPGSGEGVPGAVLLPLASLSALFTLLVFLATTGMWRLASTRELFGFEIPFPGKWTALSGICTATILTTTTLAYTFKGVSIVFIMLLMRGGVLVIAPIIDALTQRTARWFSWMGLGLSLSALLVAFSERGGYSISPACAIDIGVYLLAYFVRLRLMSHLAKSEDTAATGRYFVEEQLMATPLVVAVLAGLAVVNHGELMGHLRTGFTTHLHSGLVVETLIVGVLSQGVIMFGGLIFLDHREHTFSVPVNRSFSVLAGVLASFGLAAILGAAPPSVHQLAGAALVLLAIIVLAAGPRMMHR